MPTYLYKSRTEIHLVLDKETPIKDIKKKIII